MVALVAVGEDTAAVVTDTAMMVDQDDAVLIAIAISAEQDS